MHEIAKAFRRSTMLFHGIAVIASSRTMSAAGSRFRPNASLKLSKSACAAVELSRIAARRSSVLGTKAKGSNSQVLFNGRLGKTVINFQVCAVAFKLSNLMEPSLGTIKRLRDRSGVRAYYRRFQGREGGSKRIR